MSFTVRMKVKLYLAGQVLFSANATWTEHIAVIWDNMKVPFSIKAMEQIWFPAIYILKIWAIYFMLYFIVFSVILPWNVQLITQLPVLNSMVTLLLPKVDCF